MTLSTMQDFPLAISQLFQHGRRVHADSRVVTWSESGTRSARFAEVAARADRLAGGLTRLGIRPGARVGTFAWNNQQHLEAYLAIPSMGAVLHTLNIRLFPEQLAYVINHAEDEVILVDASIAPLLAKVRSELRTVQHIVTFGEGDTSGLGDTVDYETLLADSPEGFEYPEIDERSAAAMCYTSGTTGNPKGVAYSHRSTFLHSLAATSGQSMGFSERDRLLLIVPMFHANAWGMPYAGWSVGADLVLPHAGLQAEPLVRMIEETKPTYSGAVPTVLNDILANQSGADLSSLRGVICGGSAVPQSLIEGFDKTFGVPITQAWGMTETSPLAALAHVPKNAAPSAEIEWRVRTGRPVAGVEIRICGEDGAELPWDGDAQGEIEIRGPWITGSYYKDDDPEKFHDGWLRTGDVGTIEPNGFITISDRAKDVIKSGGEWISSVDLENALIGHPAILEAAVIGIPDERWDERPLACLVPVAGAEVDLAELRAFLEKKVAKWWLPEKWAVIDEVPKTSVGKFDKKVLRKQFAEGEFSVQSTS